MQVKHDLVQAEPLSAKGMEEAYHLKDVQARLQGSGAHCCGDTLPVRPCQ